MMIRLILVTAAILLVPHPSFGDASGPYFNVSAEEVSREVLKGAIGAMKIGFRKATDRVRVYKESQKGFFGVGTLEVGDLIPLSSVGYIGPIPGRDPIEPEYFNKSAFPVTEVNGDYVKLFKNPRSSDAIWVNKNEFEDIRRFSGSLPPHNFVDLFFFSEMNSVDVYESPDGKAVVRTIQNESVSEKVAFSSFQSPYYEGVKVEGGYLLIKEIEWAEAADGAQQKELGWVRIRGKDGALIVWIH